VSNPNYKPPKTQTPGDLEPLNEVTEQGLIMKGDVNKVESSRDQGFNA